MGQFSEGYIQWVHVQSKSIFQVSCICQEVFISNIISLCTKWVWTRLKRFKKITMLVELVKKATQTRWLTSDHTTQYTSKTLLHFEHYHTVIVCVAQVNVRAYMSDVTSLTGTKLHTSQCKYYHILIGCMAHVPMSELSYQMLPTCI